MCETLFKIIDFKVYAYTHLIRTMPLSKPIANHYLLRVKSNLVPRVFLWERPWRRLGHVTLIKICSRGRVGECRKNNYFTTPCCRIRRRLPFVFTFAKLNSLYSEVILKPKQVFFLQKDLPRFR